MARILITGFCAVPGPTRAGVQLRHVVRALSPGHTVDLLVVREGDQAYVERQGNGRLLRVPTHDQDLRAQVQAFQRALRRQLEGADYDVVHCRDGWSAHTVLESRDRFGYAIVFDLTRAPMTERALYEPDLVAELDRDEEACLLGADLILVPTEPARRYALARGRPERVVLAPPGVDVDRFDWDVPVVVGAPVVLYAGALAPGHGVRVLLRAMVDVVRVTAARLVLCGPIAPGFADTLRGGIAELGLGARVELRPPVDHDQMPALIASATVCVAPSAADLTPRPYALYPTKLLEYMACRRAVVAPRRGTVAMLVDHGREGLLFQPGDPTDLARKLGRLLEDHGLRERLAQNGYERVRREFTASGARRGIRNAYAQLAAQPEWRPRFVETPTGSHELDPPSSSTSQRARSLGGDGPDDDFEATVYEAAPTGSRTPSLEVALESSLDGALVTLDAESDDGDSVDDGDDGVGDVRTDGPFTEERSFPVDPTQERLITDADGGTGSGRLIERPHRRGRVRTSPFDRGAWPAADGTLDGPLDAHRKESWVVVHTGRDRDRADDEGTPIDVVPVPPPAIEPSAFVAGEIDVPTPAPELVEEDGVFTAASRLLGPKPDTQP